MSADEWKQVKPEAVLAINAAHIAEVAAKARRDIREAEEVIIEARRVLHGMGEDL